MALSITRLLFCLDLYFSYAAPNFGIYNIWHSVIGITIHLKNLYDITACVFIAFLERTFNHRIICKGTNDLAFKTLQSLYEIMFARESVQNRINSQLHNFYISCADVINWKSWNSYFCKCRKWKMNICLKQYILGHYQISTINGYMK